MTKTETAEKKTTPMVAKSPEMIRKLFNAERLKKDIEEHSKICDAIEVVDETSAKILREKITLLNKLNIAGGKTKMILKAPALTEAKNIDTVYKEIFGPIDACVLRGKDKLRAYETAELKRIADEKAAEEKAARDKEKALLDAASESKKSIDDLYTIQKSAIVLIGQTNTMEQLKGWHTMYSAPSTSYLKSELASDFPDSVTNALNRMSMLKNARKIYLTDKNIEAWNKVVEVAIAQIESEKIGIINEIETETEEAVAEIVVQNEAMEIANASKPAVPMKWDYEVVSFEDIPKAWKMVNFSEVTNFISANKNTLKDGDVVNGIKFFKVPNIILNR
jgi:hypothetical protein